MPRKEDFVEIQALAKASVYQRDIVEQLGVHLKKEQIKKQIQEP